MAMAPLESAGAPFVVRHRSTNARNGCEIEPFALLRRGACSAFDPRMIETFEPARD
jgi:hypothetical protein